MANVSDSGNPADPPPGYMSVAAYRAVITDNADTAINEPVKIIVF